MIISGTPGTGKTTLAKEIAKRFSMKYIDVNELIEKHDLAVGFDKKRDCRIIDEDKLNGVLDSVEGDVVIDSHLSHHMSPQKCIITKCGLKELKKRLEKRGYSDAKVRENMDSEIFDICHVEASEAGHDVMVVETDKEIDYEAIGRFIGK